LGLDGCALAANGSGRHYERNVRRMGILTVGRKMSQHTGKTISLADAEAFLREIRKIMLEHQTNFGPACEIYGKRQQEKEKKNEDL
jgi:hypothetical protein